MSTRKEKIMQRNGELLDAVRAKTGLDSDYKIAQKMGVHVNLPAKWRKGLKLNNHALIWLAVTLEREVGETVALYEMALAPEKERPFWADFLSNVRRISGWLGIALLLGISGICGSDPAVAGGLNGRRQRYA
jgi:hypothetical protein